MKLDRYHDSSLREVLNDLFKLMLRLPKPMLSQAKQMAASEVDPSAAFYGSIEQARAEFAHHAGINLNAPEMGRRQLLLAAMAGSAPAERRQQVFDIGGSTGLHLAQVEAVLGPCPHLDWVVIETEAYCEVASTAGRPGVQYYPTLQAALEAGKSPDCIYSNSALQYFPDPVAELTRYAQTPARAIAFERVPLCRSQNTIHAMQTLHRSNRSVSKAPISIAPIDSLVLMLEHAGFHVALYRESRAAFRYGSQFISLYSLLAVRPNQAKHDGPPQ